MRAGSTRRRTGRRPAGASCRREVGVQGGSTGHLEPQAAPGAGEGARPPRCPRGSPSPSSRTPPGGRGPPRPLGPAGTEVAPGAGGPSVGHGHVDHVGEAEQRRARGTSPAPATPPAGAPAWRTRPASSSSEAVGQRERLGVVVRDGDHRQLAVARTARGAPRRAALAAAGRGSRAARRAGAPAGPGPARGPGRPAAARRPTASATSRRSVPCEADERRAARRTRSSTAARAGPASGARRRRWRRRRGAGTGRGPGTSSRRPAGAAAMAGDVDAVDAPPCPRRAAAGRRWRAAAWTCRCRSGRAPPTTSPASTARSHVVEGDRGPELARVAPVDLEARASHPPAPAARRRGSPAIDEQHRRGGERPSAPRSARRPGATLSGAGPTEQAGDGRPAPSGASARAMTIVAPNSPSEMANANAGRHQHGPPHERQVDGAATPGAGDAPSTAAASRSRGSIERSTGVMVRTTNGSATTACAIGTSHGLARRSTGSSRAMRNPKPTVTADVPSGRRSTPSMDRADPPLRARERGGRQRPEHHREHGRHRREPQRVGRPPRAGRRRGASRRSTPPRARHAGQAVAIADAERPLARAPAAARRATRAMNARLAATHARSPRPRTAAPQRACASPRPWCSCRRSSQSVHDEHRHDRRQLEQREHRRRPGGRGGRPSAGRSRSRGWSAPARRGCAPRRSW